MQVGQFETNDVLRQVLRIIGRTILPRLIDLQTTNGRLQIEASAQRMLLCPKRDGQFLLDDELNREAPSAWDILRGGPGDAISEADILHAHRDALLRHCARALHGLASGAATVEWSVRALRPGERADGGLALPSFGVDELAAALTPGMAVPNTLHAAPAIVTPSIAEPPGGHEPVAAFYRQIAAKITDAWLFEASGEAAGVPPRASGGAAVAEMAGAAAHARTWREDIGALVEGPVIAVFVEPSRESLRCVAIDGEHVALLQCTSLELGPVLAGWRAAQQNDART